MEYEVKNELGVGRFQVFLSFLIIFGAADKKLVQLKFAQQSQNL